MERAAIPWEITCMSHQSDTSVGNHLECGLVVVHRIYLVLDPSCLQRDLIIPPSHQEWVLLLNEMVNLSTSVQYLIIQYIWNGFPFPLVIGHAFLELLPISLKIFHLFFDHTKYFLTIGKYLIIINFLSVCCKIKKSIVCIFMTPIQLLSWSSMETLWSGLFQKKFTYLFSCWRISWLLFDVFLNMQSSQLFKERV